MLGLLCVPRQYLSNEMTFDLDIWDYGMLVHLYTIWVNGSQLFYDTCTLSPYIRMSFPIAEIVQLKRCIANNMGHYAVKNDIICDSCVPSTLSLLSTMGLCHRYSADISAWLHHDWN